MIKPTSVRVWAMPETGSSEQNKTDSKRAAAKESFPCFPFAAAPFYDGYPKAGRIRTAYSILRMTAPMVSSPAPFTDIPSSSSQTDLLPHSRGKIADLIRLSGFGIRKDHGCIAAAGNPYGPEYRLYLLSLQRRALPVCQSKCMGLLDTQIKKKRRSPKVSVNK